MIAERAHRMTQILAEGLRRLGFKIVHDAFFDTVTVNADDPALRANRLALLSAIAKTMNLVADFSRVEG